MSSRQTRARRGIPHPCQLALAGVLILGVRQSILAVPVAFLFPPCVLPPSPPRPELMKTSFYDLPLLTAPGTGVHAAAVDGAARRRRRSSGSTASRCASRTSAPAAAQSRSRSRSTARTSRSGRPTRARLPSSSHAQNAERPRRRGSRPRRCREICSSRSRSPSTWSSRTCRICRTSEHDPRYDDEPPDAVYAPGDGLGPYRSLLDACRDGKLETGGTLLIQFHRQAAGGGLLAARGSARAAGNLGVDSR